MTEKKSSQKEHHSEPQTHFIASESDHSNESSGSSDSTPAHVPKVAPNESSALDGVPSVQYVLVGAGTASYHAMKVNISWQRIPFTP